jgi:hypothetical protein
MKEKQLVPSEETKAMSKYVAMVVRNAMEGFHVKHLSDEQMAELNPIVRNAICSALHAAKNYDYYENAKRFVDWNTRMIPDYWEDPDIDSSLKRDSGYDETDLESVETQKDPQEVRVAESRLVSDVAVTVADVNCSSPDPEVDMLLEIGFEDGSTAEVETLGLPCGRTLFWEVDELDEIEAMEMEDDPGDYTDRAE